jgi:flavin reductase (DIM6/NTAB) family NADH-FMN oxidoreductase RutF
MRLSSHFGLENRMDNACYFLIFPVKMALPPHIQPVEPAHAWRLLNTGATVLVSAAHGSTRNAMAAAWNMALDYAPVPKAAVVIDKSTFTRGLIEASNRFALGVPTQGIANQTYTLGSLSGRDAPGADKLAALGIESFTPDDAHGIPMVAGCAGWLLCERIAEPHIEQTYDLFIGRITAAWADERAFANGKFKPIEQIPPALRTLHHLGAGEFVMPGAQIKAVAAKFTE